MMGSETWEQFAGNLAFVALAFAMWAHFSIWYQHLFSKAGRLLLGIVAGGTSIGSMLLAIETQPGIFIDLRFAPIALAGGYGGVIPALLAAVPAILFRFWLGGVGADDGVIAIVGVTVIGLVVRMAARRRPLWFPKLVALTVSVAGALSLMTATLPSLTAVSAFSTFGLPLALMNAIAVAICGLIVIKTRKVEIDRILFERAFSQSPDFIYVKDRDSRFITVNENMARLFRFSSPSEMVGLSDFNLRTAPVAEELYHREQEILRTGEPLIDSMERLGERYLLASKVPLKDGEGRIIGLAGVTRDISEMVRLERELRESRNLLSHAMAGMSDGFAMFDRDGYLIYCNEQYRDAFPLSRDARVVGAHISDILRHVVQTGERVGVPADAGREWIEIAAATLHRNKDEEAELVNGEWRAIKTRLSDDGTAMVVVSDITAAKKAERALTLSAEQLRSQATTDSLTGCLNRRALNEALVGMTARCAREGQPLSLLMLDVDHFKQYNDIYGHVAGDKCLHEVADCMRAGLAALPSSVTGRYGGEEFLLLLPGANEEQAQVFAERVLHLLNERHIPHRGSEEGHVTASIGLTTAVGKALLADPIALISDADGALYVAKQQGRNRVVACHGNEDISGSGEQDSEGESRSVAS